MKTRIGNKKCIAPKKKKKGTHIVNSERVKDFSFNGFCFFDWKQTNKKKKLKERSFTRISIEMFSSDFYVWINSIYFRFNRKLVKIPKIFWVEIYTDCAHSSIHSLWKSMEDTLVKYIGVYFKLKRIWCFFLSRAIKWPTELAIKVQYWTNWLNGGSFYWFTIFFSLSVSLINFVHVSNQEWFLGMSHKCQIKIHSSFVTVFFPK